MKRTRFISAMFMVGMTFLGVVQISGQRYPSVRTDVQDKYLISASAGVVNQVGGPVLLKSMDGAIAGLTAKQALKPGEKIISGRGGKVEILLNPGSYLRLGANSEASFISTNLANLQVSVTKGSAMIEASLTDKFNIVFFTPNSKFTVLKSGIYRIDVADNNSTRVEVTKGKIQFADEQKTTVGKSKAAVISSGNGIAIEKFDTDNLDSLEAWSRDRSRNLAEMNTSLGYRNRGYIPFSTNDYDPYYSGSRFPRMGVWLWDQMARSYVYFPYSYSTNPYGYGMNFGWYGTVLPGNLSNNNNNVIPNNGGNQTGNNTSAPVQTGNDGTIVRPPRERHPDVEVNTDNSGAYPTPREAEPRREYPRPRIDDQRVYQIPNREANVGDSSRESVPTRTHETPSVYQPRSVDPPVSSPRSSDGGGGRRSEPIVD